MVIDPGASGLQPFELIDEDEYIELEQKFGYMAVSEEDRDNENYFFASMGGEAMKEMLGRINMVELKKELVEIVQTSKSKQKKRCFEAVESCAVICFGPDKKKVKQT